VDVTVEDADDHGDAHAHADGENPSPWPSPRRTGERGPEYRVRGLFGARGDKTSGVHLRGLRVIRWAFLAICVLPGGAPAAAGKPFAMNGWQFHEYNLPKLEEAIRRVRRGWSSPCTRAIAGCSATATSPRAWTFPSGSTG